ncbi:MAG: hypothetical protein LUO89_06390 [Methanothrix sp.]|nr:hypothetical protein [Methanothrix sp.]
MQSGQYRVRCESAEIQPRYKSIVVVLVCKVSEGSWRDGVVFKQWVNIKNAKGDISPATVYARQCALALGRPVQAGDDLDPNLVFVGKEFLAEVGFSLRDEAGKFADENSQTKKTDDDYLRIHRLLQRF